MVVCASNAFRDVVWQPFNVVDSPKTDWPPYVRTFEGYSFDDGYHWAVPAFVDINYPAAWDRLFALKRPLAAPIVAVIDSGPERRPTGGDRAL